MIPARFRFFTVMVVLSCLWAVTALLAYNLRYQHRHLIQDIRAGRQVQPARLDAAITHYQRILALTPCNAKLYDDLGLLAAYGVDTAMEGEDMDRTDAELAQMQQVLNARLGCMPSDGKAWLDLAIITSYREGLSKQALADYAMSARVSPGESWLAQKRLSFAVKFRPLLDAEAKAVVTRDMATLSHAHPNHMTAVMDEAGVKTPEAFAALFAE